MRTNTAMRNFLGELQVDRPLAPSLKAMAESGFDQSDGCNVLRGLPVITNVTRSTLGDCTGYECFVNSLHIEDYEAEQPLAQAILFIMRVFGVWNRAKQNTCLIAIVSANELSVVVKFHVRRSGEQWLSDNIEGYEDAVMSIDSDEGISSLLNNAH